MNTQIRIVLAVILAGIIGTLVNAFAASVIVSPDKLNFMYVANRYFIAIAVVALLPVLGMFLSGNGLRIVGLISLILIPTLIAKLVLFVGAPWGLVIVLNAFYAFGAYVSYLLLSGKKRII